MAGVTRLALFACAAVVLDGCVGGAQMWVPTEGGPKNFASSEPRSDLTECVKQNDPKRMGDLDDGRDYVERGWFDSGQAGLVGKCMATKGWTLIHYM
jgi:hypothetical protein